MTVLRSLTIAFMLFLMPALLVRVDRAVAQPPPRPGRLAFVRAGSVFIDSGDNRAPPRKLLVPGAANGPLSWSPDGKSLAVGVTTNAGESHVVVGAPLVETWRDISPASASDQDPAWARDGDPLAISRTVGSNRAIVIVRRDGSSAV